MIICGICTKHTVMFGVVCIVTNAWQISLHNVVISNTCQGTHLLTMIQLYSAWNCSY